MDLVSLVEERRGWERLTSTPEWGKLVSVLQEQADELQAGIIYSPLRSSDEVYLQEFRKGQLEGRLSVSNTVATLIAELDAEINRLKEQDDGRTDHRSDKQSDVWKRTAP